MGLEPPGKTIRVVSGDRLHTHLMSHMASKRTPIRIGQTKRKGFRPQGRWQTPRGIPAEKIMILSRSIEGRVWFYVSRGRDEYATEDVATLGRTW